MKSRLACAFATVLFAGAVAAQAQSSPPTDKPVTFTQEPVASTLGGNGPDAQLANDLQTKPETRARVEEIKEQLLDNRSVSLWLDAVWQKAREWGGQTPDGVVFAFLAHGAFVLGNLSPTGAITFWGAQWATLNLLSGGPAPPGNSGNPTAASAR